MKPDAPLPGQESVWDYPRPPRIEPCAKRVRVEYGGVTIVDTRRAWRLLETSHPPAYYIPPDDVLRGYFRASHRRSFCEFKGEASYWDIEAGDRTSHDAAWSYAAPVQLYASIAGHFAFYPSRVDACFVDEERVQPQPGDFYGGWITSMIVGPFKGGPGSGYW